MSLRAWHAVRDHSIHTGSARYILSLIADCADGGGGGAPPSIETLAAWAHVSVRQAERAVSALVASGELEVRPGPDAGHPAGYRILLPGAEASVAHPL